MSSLICWWVGFLSVVTWISDPLIVLKNIWKKPTRLIQTNHLVPEISRCFVWCYRNACSRNVREPLSRMRKDYMFWSDTHDQVFHACHGSCECFIAHSLWCPKLHATPPHPKMMNHHSSKSSKEGSSDCHQPKNTGHKQVVMNITSPFGH